MARKADKEKIKNEKAKARSPETEANELRRLARQYPNEVLANPVLPLLSLEVPALFAEIKQIAEDARQEFWIRTQLRRSSPAQRRLFVAYCAELVLPFFEEFFPEERRPRWAIDAARLHAAGALTEERLHKAHQSAREVLENTEILGPERRAVEAAAEAAGPMFDYTQLGRAALRAAGSRAHQEAFFSRPKHRDPLEAMQKAERLMRIKQVGWLQRNLSAPSPTAKDSAG